MKLKQLREHRRVGASTSEVVTGFQERPEKLFDPRNDLELEQIQQMKDYLYSQIRDEHAYIGDVLKRIIDVKILFPEMVPEFEQDKRLKRWIVDFISRSKADWQEGQLDSTYHLLYLAKVILIYPELKQELGAGEQGFESLNKAVQNCRVHNDWVSFALWVKTALLLYPDRRADLVQKSDAANMVTTMRLFAEAGEYEQVLEVAAGIRIIAPEVHPENEMEAGYYQWLVHQYLESFDDEATSISIKKSVLFALIAADEVKVDENGITLLNHQEFDSASDLPVRSRVA